MYHRSNRIVEEARRFDDSLGNIARQLDSLYKQVKIQSQRSGLGMHVPELKREALSTTVFVPPKFDD